MSSPGFTDEVFPLYEVKGLGYPGSIAGKIFIQILLYD